MAAVRLIAVEECDAEEVLHTLIRRRYGLFNAGSVTPIYFELGCERRSVHPASVMFLSRTKL